MNNFIILTIGYKCNNNCINCMLANCLDKLDPISYNEYEHILVKTKQDAIYDSLILSGGEVTLTPDLVKFISYAKKLNYFKHIRIQTNGRLLADFDYCKSIVEAGVDEFFVSVYGATPAKHEALTKAMHSFDQTIGGLRNICSLGAKIITNTVVTSINYQDLENIVDLVYKTAQVHEVFFTNYLPMSTYDSLDLLVKNEEVKPFLFSAIELASKFNIKVFLDGFPKCYFKHAYCQSYPRAQIFIDDKFWSEYQNNYFRCIYKETCKDESCLQLPLAYINKYGWDRAILKSE